MFQQHAALYEQARAAISKLFTDDSVLAEKTKASLLALIEYAQGMLCALDAIIEEEEETEQKRKRA